jgi:hypothetical protein
MAEWTNAAGDPVMEPTSIADFYKRADLNEKDLKKWIKEQPVVGAAAKKKSQAEVIQAQKSFNAWSELVESRQGLNPEKKPLTEEQRAAEDAARSPQILIMEKFQQQILDLENSNKDYRPDQNNLRAYVEHAEELKVSDLESGTHPTSEAINIVKTRLRSLSESCGASGMKVVVVKGTTGQLGEPRRPSAPITAANATSRDERLTMLQNTFYGIAEKGKPIPMVGDLISVRFPDPASPSVGVWNEVLTHMGTVKEPLSGRNSFNGAGKAPVR